MLTETTGDAELVVWDGAEFGYCGLLYSQPSRASRPHFSSASSQLGMTS